MQFYVFNLTIMASLKFTIPLVLFTIIFWTALFCDAKTNAGEVLRKGLRYQREFDYFQFSLRWPGTYCNRTTECCTSNACCRSRNRPTGFTIQGLWPDYNDGTWPVCCPGEAFDIEKISPLLGALDTYWPSLTCDSSLVCTSGEGLIWEREWENHGTCASSVLGDQYNYFLTALDLYHRYDVAEVLREAGFVPANNALYLKELVISAIENAFPATPQLECSGDALDEVHLCFTKDFKPRGCSSAIYIGRLCPAYVRLPLIPQPREVKLKLPTSV